MGRTWTEYFFRGCPPDLVTLFHESPQTPDDLQGFNYDRAWRLGKPVRTNLPRGHPIMALRLASWQKGGSRTCHVAKTFSDFPIQEAERIIRMSGLKPAYFLAQEVQRQADPFMIEARAHEHIKRLCPTSHKPYFPEYLGVITDIKRSEYPSSCVLRPRAVVLEAIFPDLSSRRILTETDNPINSLASELQERLHESNLSAFENDWHTSLFNNRIRQITALHDIGITHGDVRDDHFRLREDFHDTVLYDFSASYTFSPSMPCIRHPRPLLDLTVLEKRQVLEIVLGRAADFDLRHHLSRTLNLDLDSVVELCSQPSMDEQNLELLVFKVSKRPDGFSMPTLASIFPFLENIRPEEFPSWHISRARALSRYTGAWATRTEGT